MEFEPDDQKNIWPGLLSTALIELVELFLLPGLHRPYHQVEAGARGGGPDRVPGPGLLRSDRPQAFGGFRRS